jgi:hypothetical protein
MLVFAKHSKFFLRSFKFTNKLFSRYPLFDYPYNVQQAKYF